jgi:hypothetical protein
MTAHQKPSDEKNSDPDCKHEHYFKLGSSNDSGERFQQPHRNPFSLYPGVLHPQPTRFFYNGLSASIASHNQDGLINPSSSSKSRAAGCRMYMKKVYIFSSVLLRLDRTTNSANVLGNVFLTPNRTRPTPK